MGRWVICLICNFGFVGLDEHDRQIPELVALMFIFVFVVDRNHKV